MHRLITFAVSVTFTLVFASIANASIVTFLGSDSGASTAGAASIAARANFDIAVALLGPTSTIDFESVTLGSFSSRLVAPNVTVSGTDLRIADALLPSCNIIPLCGGNTTAGGSRFLQGGTQTFTFGSGIQGFGAYFGGLQGDGLGQETITFTDDTSKTVNIPNISSGFAFVGFTTDQGPLITSLQINLTFGTISDNISLDDVRVVGSATSVPEPPPLVLLVAGLAGLFLIGLVQRQGDAAD